MKELIKDYLDEAISRRQLMRGLSAAGFSAVATQSMAQSLAPPAPVPAAAADTAPAPRRSITGTGGMLFVQQLKAAGVEYIFFNPSTGDAPIYDALVEESGIQLIKGVHEGSVIAMADGYARASGKVGVALVANIGLPNAMTQVVNTYKDGIPLLLAMATGDTDVQSRDGVQEIENPEQMLGPMTKWSWKAGAAAGIPETTRRALKFAATPPSGPVFLSLPESELRATATATIADRALFNIRMNIRPAASDVEQIARMLIEARNPLLTVGDEVTLANAQDEVQQLAELLGLPVMGAATYGQWSTPFPTRNPLFLGALQTKVPALGQIDLHLNIGSRDGEQVAPGVRLISIRTDPKNLGRVTPVDLGVVADPKLAALDLIDAVKSLATPTRLAAIAKERTERIAAHTQKAHAARLALAKEFAGGTPITLARLALELEQSLDRQALYVADVDSGRTMDPLLSFGGKDKTYYGNGPSAMGWGIAAAMGVKLARPDMPVVAVVGDGSYLFSGPMPLWSVVRYQAPITIIVLNNRSYNNERNRIWAFGGGAQLHSGKDMTCYNGNPDVDYTKAAAAFGVEGETVTDPDAIAPALARAKRANIAGRAYQVEVVIERNGIGGGSEWHPAFSIADLRKRKV